jgi:hypothetical protein
VSIKASWLRDAKVDMEALTEASFTTHKSGDAAALAGLAEHEQVRRGSSTFTAPAAAAEAAAGVGLAEDEQVGGGERAAHSLCQRQQQEDSTCAALNSVF